MTFGFHVISLMTQLPLLSLCDTDHLESYRGMYDDRRMENICSATSSHASITSIYIFRTPQISHSIDVSGSSDFEVLSKPVQTNIPRNNPGHNTR